MFFPFNNICMDIDIKFVERETWKVSFSFKSAHKKVRTSSRGFQSIYLPSHLNNQSCLFVLLFLFLFLFLFLVLILSYIIVACFHCKIFSKWLVFGLCRIGRIHLYLGYEDKGKSRKVSSGESNYSYPIPLHSPIILSYH